jgi:Fe2+ or Zn2+ uptake regulation protein
MKMLQHTHKTPQIADRAIYFVVRDFKTTSGALPTISDLCHILGTEDTPASRHTVYRWVSRAVSAGQLRLLRRSSSGRNGFYYVVDLND